MTRRPLLWTTALAMVAGVLTWAPAPGGAQELAWRVTVDAPSAPSGSHRVVVTGDAVSGVGNYPVSEVEVSLTPVGLPESCGTEPARAWVAPTDGRYEVEVDVLCNGPYSAQAVARATPLLGGPAQSQTSQPTSIGVAEVPAAPDLTAATVTGSAVRLAWTGTDEPDAAGWVVMVNGADVLQVDDAAATGAALSPDVVGKEVNVKARRWGAGGPGSSPLVSEPSGGRMPVGGTDTSTPPVQPPDPSGPPPGASAGPGSTPATPPGTSPPTTGGPRVPTRGSGSTSTLPEGYSEEIPYGVPDGAFEPGSDLSGSSRSSDEQSAAGSTAAGLVRTSEERSPGLVAPFALGLLMITIAAHIAWYLRRSRSPKSEQVSLP